MSLSGQPPDSANITSLSSPTPPPTTKPTPIPELGDAKRAGLIRRVSEHYDNVDSVTWALLWVSDIDMLEGLVNGDAKHLDRALLAQENKCRLLAWATRNRSRDDTSVTDPNAEPSSSPGPAKKRKKNPDDAERDPKLAQKANERDQGCIITRADDALEGAYIFPFSLNSQSKIEEQHFWSMLRFFWPPEQVEKWWKGVMGDVATEHLGNMITLNRYAHVLWGKGRFVLEPVALSSDKCSLTVRFWWLPSRQYSASVHINTPPRIPSNLTSYGRNSKLWNHNTEKKVCSGDEIVLVTHDALNFPLPSFELLHLSFHLTRVLGMSGAADIERETDSEHDSDVDDAQEVSFAQPRGRLATAAVTWSKRECATTYI
ncbi:hypothetical protein BDW74DRAFT_111763 [Aspergillus multicolor]|uniref:HNH endonuclease signature motif containing protein n=1 Tax=Aspergillus multicolor TaxID=41759 RepID=UPI003CCD79E5